MRLLDTTSLKLQTFYTEIPEYAILSHTWSPDGEYTLQDLQNAFMDTNDSAGYSKIVNFCALARGKGFEWVWIDTCCIDKTSSAELQEAINSMFQYYREATVCIVYMADVTDRGSYSSSEFEAAFRASRWFQRGWTLQELLAPFEVEFWSSTWSDLLGTKQSLQSMIAEATSVSMEALRGFWPKRHYAIDVVHWASRRSCARTEDKAYSLLGLLDINMPLLYGEGSKAFLRLQQEILATSDDESILSWSYSASGRVDYRSRGRPSDPTYHLLAPSLGLFEMPFRASQLDDTRVRHKCPNSWCGKQFTSEADLKSHLRNCYLSLINRPRPFTMANQGLIVRRKLHIFQDPGGGEGQKPEPQYFVPLNVSRDWTADNNLLLPIIPLRQEKFYHFWLQKDTLNFALCDRQRMCSKHDLRADYCSETTDEYEVLVLKEPPVERW